MPYIERERDWYKLIVLFDIYFIFRIILMSPEDISENCGESHHCKKYEICKLW